LLKSFATPVVWFLLLTLSGLLLARYARQRLLSRIGWCLTLTSALLLYALSLKPVVNLLTYPLESRYQCPPGRRGSLDVVVVLSGGMYSSGGLRGAADLTGDGYPRFWHGVEAFKKSGARRLVFCGGRPNDGGESEPEVMRAMALDLGVPQECIITETRSRNTMESAIALAQLLGPGQDRGIGLVTSATHMRRSYAAFTEQLPHDTIVPIPAQYMYYPMGWCTKSFVPYASNLEQSTRALHEWIGILWYALRY